MLIFIFIYVIIYRYICIFIIFHSLITSYYNIYVSSCLVFLLQNHHSALFKIGGFQWWSPVVVSGTAISVILTTALSALVLQDITLDGTFAAGTVLTIGATFMYSGLLDHLLPKWIL